MQEEGGKGDWECVERINYKLTSRPGWARVISWHLDPTKRVLEKLLIEIDSTVKGKMRVFYATKERTTPAQRLAYDRGELGEFERVSEEFEGSIQINHNPRGGPVTILFLVEEGLPPEWIEIEGKICMVKKASKKRKK